VKLVRTTGKPIAQVAAKLGLYDSTLGNRAKQDRIDRGEGYAVTDACAVMQVSTTAYYDWAARRAQPPSARQQRDTARDR
jgi:hypothetical protein